MPRNLLTDASLRKIRTGDPSKRLSDGDGLYLLVSVKGGSHGWRFDYTHEGKRKTLSLGIYPTISLAMARKRAEEARRQVAEGVDPSDARKAAKAATQRKLEEERRADAGLPPVDSFEAVARTVHQQRKDGWSPRYAARWIERMEKDLFPFIGRMRLPEVTAPVLLKVLKKIEDRGAKETAHTLRQTAGMVFRYGIANGMCDRNPAPDLHGALKPIIVKHMAAVLEPTKAGALMRSIADYEGQPTTRAALLLSALLFQRPGNIRQMEWAEVDLDGALWTIPSLKMKRKLHGKLNGRPHFVPLPRQAVETLRELHPLTGHGRYVFPSLLTGERPMSENTVNTALRRMGYTGEEMTAHGFRAMARTIIVERTSIHPDVIEAQLAHGKSGPLGSAYDRADFMEQRRQMMQTWADYLDKLRDGAKVLPFKTA